LRSGPPGTGRTFCVAIANILQRGAHRLPARIADRVLDRLERVRDASGKAIGRRYVDPFTGAEYSQRAVQTARSLGLTPERAAVARKAGVYDLLAKLAPKRKQSVGQLLDRAAASQGKTRNEVLFSSEFRKQVKALRRGHGKRGSKFERALVYFDYRDADDSHDPGDTDEVT
jgi:hypothetical protein